MSDEARAALEQALPAYEIAGRLGEGAFGVVYEGRHTQLGRHVAIKQLPKVYAENESVRERFVAEAQMVASLDHPHVVPVYDFVESEGSRFLIMERCEGSVNERFHSQGIVTDEACAAVLACLAGLEVAHAKGLLHRDVKPENLMYDTKGVVKLADFGIARDTGADTRRTATGMIVGTPAYMSPEQCRGDDLTAASDVYSVGMMAYELLTGGLPYPESDSVNGLLAHHLVTEPLPLLSARPELPGAIGEVIDRSLAKDLSVRYSSAVDFARDLARACVRAFGSGWLRRRRFVLHWPEIIAETERPSDNSPRTGTIMVKAGDATHTFPSGDVPGITSAETPAAPQPAPQPVASVGGAAAASNVAAPAPQAAPPSDITGSHGSSTDQGSNKNWVLMALVGGAIAALIAGILVISGGGDDPVAQPAVPTAAAVPTTDPGDTTDDPPPTAIPDATAEPAPTTEDTTSTAEPTEVPTPAPEPTVADNAQADPDATPTPIPAPTPFETSIVLTTRPPGIEFDVAETPLSPTPCPEDKPQVACIYIGVTLDEESGELFVPYFVEGFTPELEPTNLHLHFYLDTLVDGDENKAGSAVPGGAWKLWDAPFPATTFGGENGRTLYSVSDVQLAGARHLCVLVATASHEVLPGTGNCAPIMPVGDDLEVAEFFSRRTGEFVGNCNVGFHGQVPEPWRWFDLTTMSVEESSRLIAPANVDVVAPVIQLLVDQGGVVWADGPRVDDFTINASYTVWPGEFRLGSTPDEVRSIVGQLGYSTTSTEVRTVWGRDVLYELTDNGNSFTDTYVIPDFGKAVVVAFTYPKGNEFTELSETLAGSIIGC